MSEPSTQFRSPEVAAFAAETVKNQTAEGVPANSRARIRVAFTDYPGMTMQHCHILDHEDPGMMATVLME